MASLIANHGFALPALLSSHRQQHIFAAPPSLWKTVTALVRIHDHNPLSSWVNAIRSRRLQAACTTSIMGPARHCVPITLVVCVVISLASAGETWPRHERDALPIPWQDEATGSTEDAVAGPSTPTPSPTQSPTGAPTQSPEQPMTGAGCGISIGSRELCATLATGERCATEAEVAAICAAECCDPEAENHFVDGGIDASVSSVAPTPAPARWALQEATPIRVSDHCDLTDIGGEALCQLQATPASCLTDLEISILCSHTCCHLQFTLAPTTAPFSSTPSTAPSQVPSYTGHCPTQFDLMLLLGKQMTPYLTPTRICLFNCTVRGP